MGLLLSLMNTSLGWPTAMYQKSILLQAITPVALPYRLSFCLHIPQLLICFVGLGHYLSMVRWGFILILPQRKYHIFRSFFWCLIWFILFCCICSYLHNLIACRSILLLILIMLIGLCVCFLMMWSLFLLLDSSFWCF